MKFNIRTAEVNLCETNDSTCKDNLNLSRIEMPVIEEDFLNLLEDGMLDIQDIFLTKRTKKKNMPCMKVDLNGKKLLKIANAYTDAKGIKRKE